MEEGGGLGVCRVVGVLWGHLPKRSFVIIFYCHICVLLVKAISMIYICYIKYIINAACVLAVGDDELGVGDDNDASSEVAGGRGRRGGLVGRSAGGRGGTGG